MPFTNAMLFAARSQGSLVSFASISGATGTHFDAVTTIISDPINMFGPADNSGINFKGAPFLADGTYKFTTILAYSGTSGGFHSSCIFKGVVGSGGGGDPPTSNECVVDPFVEGDTSTDTVAVGTYGMWLGSKMVTIGSGSTTGTAIIEIHKMY